MLGRRIEEGRKKGERHREGVSEGGYKVKWDNVNLSFVMSNFCSIFANRKSDFRFA